MKTLQSPHRKSAFLLAILGIVSAVVLGMSNPAEAYSRTRGGHAGSEAAGSSIAVPATGSIEVAFSPNEGSVELVCKAIDSATKEIRGLAYSFTSAEVVSHLIAARHRGVDVKIVVDYKENIAEDRSGKARAALSALVNAGADMRTISVYPIHHDKVLIVDEKTVEFGSFNYSEAAAHKNSENVFVNWDNPTLAAVYLRHFARNYQQSQPFAAGY